MRTKDLYHFILKEGGTFEDAIEASKNIKQISKGYYSTYEVIKFIENKRILKNER